MTIKKKSATVKCLESLTGGPLTLQSLIESIQEGEEWTKRGMAEKLGVSPTY
jgi:nicotinamide mononucleotide (NMN) deamidase PncC